MGTVVAARDLVHCTLRPHSDEESRRGCLVWRGGAWQSMFCFTAILWQEVYMRRSALDVDYTHTIISEAESTEGNIAPGGSLLLLERLTTLWMNSVATRRMKDRSPFRGFGQIFVTHQLVRAWPAGTTKRSRHAPSLCAALCGPATRSRLSHPTKNSWLSL